MGGTGTGGYGAMGGTGTGGYGAMGGTGSGEGASTGDWTKQNYTMSSLVICFVCFLWRCGPTRAMASSFLRFLDHTQRRITVGRTPLDE